MNDAFAGLSAERLQEMLHQMLLIRSFEESAEQLYFQGMIHGTMHLSIGQEGSAVGACAALRAEDYILSTHRGHGHCIAKGARAGEMMAEFFGKETGYCRGRGGSMHMADVDTGNLGANGIVAGGVPMAAGVGLSIQMQRQDRVVAGLLWRRRGQRRRISREPQPGGDLESAGHLLLREQPLRHVHVDLQGQQDREPQRAGGGLRHPRRDRRRQRRDRSLSCHA